MWTIERQKLSGSELKYYTGKQAALIAEELWNALDEQRQRMMLWGVAPEHKYVEFVESISQADVVCVAYRKGEVFCFAWAAKVMPGSRTAHAHFAFTGDVDVSITKTFIEDVRTTRLYDSLFAIQPMAYKAARKHAIELGFVILGNVPGLLPMYGREKPCTGVLLVKDMR